MSTRIANIIACEVVAATMKHLLGPKSMDKFIVNSFGEIIVTNDGVTALENMDIEHPAAKLLVQLSRAMDDSHGDGTTSVVVLAGELLSQAKELLNRGIHPIKIIKGYMSAGIRASEIIMEMAHPFIPTSIEGRNILVETAKTALHSKLVSHAAPHLALLAVDALLNSQKRSTAHLHVVLVNGLYDESKIFPGIILETELVNKIGTGDDTRPLSFALLQFPLVKPKPAQNVKIVVSSSHDVDKLLREEEAYIKSLVVAIKKLGIEAIGIEDQVISETIPDVAKALLTKVKIKILPKLNKKMFMTLSNYLCCTPLTSIEMLSNPDSKKYLVKAKIYEVSIGSESRACVEAENANLRTENANLRTESARDAGGTANTLNAGAVVRSGDALRAEVRAENAQVGTVVLCGGSEMYLAEAERAFHDAVCVVSTLIKNPKIVPGAGVCESEISVQIEKEAGLLEDVNGMIWSAFASAMEAIPLTLAQNAGMDALSIMAQLKAKHISPEGKLYGVDVFEECIADMYEKKVWEPLVNKQAQCIMAAEVATSILKIDSIHSVNEILSRAPEK